jgi:hypothetical protein
MILTFPHQWLHVHLTVPDFLPLSTVYSFIFLQLVVHFILFCVWLEIVKSYAFLEIITGSLQSLKPPNIH